MWAALALTTVLNLAPAQAGGPEIKNVRLTHGVLGATRTDTNILPGDIAVVSFDIHGLIPRKDGKVLYSAGFELIKKKDRKALMAQALAPKEAINSLGGSVVPSVTFVNFGLDTEEGTYVIKVTIKDTAGKSAVLEKEVEVTKRKFGFVRVRFMAPTDPSAPLPAPPLAVPGQAIHLRYSLAGFKADKSGLSNIEVEMTVKDSDGKATIAPAKAVVQSKFKESEPFMDFLPIPLQLNRTGKYKVVLKAKDSVTGNTTEQSLDLEVVKN